MLHKKLSRLAGVFLVLLLASVALVAGAALAQESFPNTEPGGEYIESPGVYGEPDGATPQLLAPQEFQSQTDDGEPNPDQREMPTGPAPDDNPSTMAPVDPQVTFGYYIISGATLRARSSNATGYVYDGMGCTYSSFGTGTDRILNTELTLPHNAIIKYLRVIYRDFDPAGSVSGYITRYEPGKKTEDIIAVGSTNVFAGGYGWVVSNEITHTVDNQNYAYTLIGWPSANSDKLQICGLRVAYFDPVTSSLIETGIGNSQDQATIAAPLTQQTALVPESEQVVFNYFEVSGATLRGRSSSAGRIFLPWIRR